MNKRDFYEGCKVHVLDTPDNTAKGICGMLGKVKHHNSTLGVLVKLQSGEWVYYSDRKIGVVAIGEDRE